MKDNNIELAPTIIYKPYKQCYGKKQYDFKRRALKDARLLAIDTGLAFTIYECPHCGKYHVGSVRK